MKTRITGKRVLKSVCSHICFILLLPLLLVEALGKGATYLDDKLHTLNRFVRDKLE